MSKSKDDKAEAPAKKGGFMKILILLVAMLAAAGGGAYGAFAMGLFGDGGAGHHEPDVPKKVRKGEEDPYAPAVKGDAPVDIPGEGGSEYRTSYYEFEDAFTSNLLDSPGLIQLSLAASTQYDGRVVRWLEKHDLALRSRVLVELANTPEDDVYSPEGRERLQERIVAAINDELTGKEGFGGVDKVYFREFLVQ